MLFAALLALWLICAPIFAAPGGSYTVEEGVGLHVDIDADWIVFTKQTAEDDGDIAKYGDYQTLMADMEKDGVSLLAYHRTKGVVLIAVDENSEELKKIKNLTDVYVRMSEKEKEALKEEIKQEARQEQGRVVGLYFSDEVNKKNNYVYVHIEYTMGEKKLQSYATVINGKLVSFTHYPLVGSEVSEADKTALLAMLGGAHYDNQPTVEQAAANIVAQKAHNAARLRVGAIAAGLILAMVALYRTMHRKEKRQRQG